MSASENCASASVSVIAGVVSICIVGEACFGDRYETDNDINEGNRISEEEILRLINPLRS